MIKRMRKILILALVALFLAAGCAHTAKPAAPAKSAATAVKSADKPFDPSTFTVHERMVHSVVMLPGCTGFVVGNDGNNALILTAKHCVTSYQEVAKDGTITMMPVPVATNLGWKKLCFGTVLAMGETSDIALIGVEECKLPTVVAPLAASEPKTGETVYAVGHPIGAHYVMTKGIVSRPRLDGRILVSAPAISGNSGGPIFNRRGEVVGLVTSTIMAPTYKRDGTSFKRGDQYVHVPHLQFGVALDNIKSFLKKHTEKAK